jgi:protease I
MKKLSGKKIAILVAKGFEQVELVDPRKALEKAGADTFIVSPETGELRAWKETKWGKSFVVDIPLAEAHPDEFDGLLLPGGVMNPDHLRMSPEAINFIRAFGESGKPIAAICHGPWTLIDAGIAAGRRLTSYPSIRKDLENAGAHWVDEEVVVDNGLVTSRKPADIPAFNQKMVEEFCEGVHLAGEVAPSRDAELVGANASEEG